MGLEVVVESSDTTKARTCGNVGNLHVGGLEQMARMFQTAVADEVGHRVVVAALRKGVAYLHGGQVETVADGLTVEQWVEIKLLFANLDGDAVEEGRTTPFVDWERLAL